MEDFKLIHLSDLHICGYTPDELSDRKKGKNHRHSIPHMKGIQKIIEKESSGLDRLIISGDVSHYGDENNLLLAKQWIYNTLEIGNEEKISIGLSEEDHYKIKLVPGNHDAWNLKHQYGKIKDIRQKSLSNFNFAFKRDGKDVITFPDGYYYDWVEKEGKAIFLVFLDSSFIGDTQIEKENPELELTLIDKVAKGKISKTQAQSVLMLYDRGMTGKLKKPNTDEYINKETFGKALKIIVMHHYLFEPYGQKREPLLQINETETVFRNFALADMDVLICGHKHYSEVKSHLYLHHFDKRAKARYIFNYFRRLIGIHSLPFQYSDKSGKMASKLFSSIISIFVRNFKSHNDNKAISTDTEFVESLAKILLEGINNPEVFEQQLRQFIKQNQASYVDDKILDENEILEITRTVRTSFTDEEREKLKVLTKTLNKVIKELFSRQFIQLMAGSACKETDNDQKFRSFNIYRITANDEGYELKCENYIWDHESKDFNDAPVSVTYEFKTKNRPLH